MKMRKRSSYTQFCFLNVRCRENELLWGEGEFVTKRGKEKLLYQEEENIKFTSTGELFRVHCDTCLTLKSI
jgi:hypothetical protein